MHATGDEKFLRLSWMSINGTRRMRNPRCQVSCSFSCVTLWDICLPSILNTYFSVLVVFITTSSTPPFPPPSTHPVLPVQWTWTGLRKAPGRSSTRRFRRWESHQSMSRLLMKFSTGPFHARPDQQHLICIMSSGCAISTWGVGQCEWWIFMSSLLRICWCWRNRRYVMTMHSLCSLSYLWIIRAIVFRVTDYFLPPSRTYIT